MTDSNDPNIAVKGRFRAWVFTSFREEKPKFDPAICKYLIFQREICPTTGRPHWQGYIYFYDKMSWNFCRELLGEIWLRKANGETHHSQTYCSKSPTSIPGTFEEHGEAPKPGKRNDLKAVVERVENGAITVEDELRYGAKLDRALARSIEMRVPEWRDVKVHVIFGPSGVGKSRRVRELEKSDEIYSLSLCGSNLWFQGYKGEKVLLIEEFTGQIQFTELLKLLDGYKYQLPIKGGHSYALWERVYITSNFHPKCWYSEYAKNHCTDALARRITDVLEMEPKEYVKYSLANLKMINGDKELLTPPAGAKALSPDFV